MNSKKEYLRELLLKIPKSYADFVNGTLADAEEYDAYDMFIDFIINNPGITSSDVVKFETDEIFHIPDIEVTK